MIRLPSHHPIRGRVSFVRYAERKETLRNRVLRGQGSRPLPDQHVALEVWRSGQGSFQARRTGVPDTPMKVLHTLSRVGRTARTRAGELRRVLLRLPSRGRVVRAAPSFISGTGCFVLRGVKSGELIGPVELGPAGAQTRHSLKVGKHHRDVAKPWRYLNHACTPTAALQFGDDSALLIAARDLRPYDELTIDYNALPEDVSRGFECRCDRCLAALTPSRIGADPIHRPPLDVVETEHVRSSRSTST
jgi:hypothetical protein